MSLNSIKIVDELLETFFAAGKLSLEIRSKNLVKKTKTDNTPVTNGDIEVNNIILNKHAIRIDFKFQLNISIFISVLNYRFIAKLGASDKFSNRWLG